MGVVTDEERALAEDESMSSGEGVVDTLITKGVLMTIQVSQAKAAQFGAEFVEIAEQTIEDDVISSVPRSVAHQYKVLPLYHDDLSVTVAISDPSDLDAIDALGQALNKEVKISVADEDEIEDALKQYYGAAKDDSVSKLIHTCFTCRVLFNERLKLSHVTRVAHRLCNLVHRFWFECSKDCHINSFP